METLYTANVRVEGGRNGKAVSSDNVLNLDLRMPLGLGGDGGHYTNPEQLFAAGYAACFDGALNLVARTKRIRIKNTVVDAAVSLGKNDSGLGISVVLDVTIPEIDRKVARELLDEAHQVCPYSKATRGNVDVEINLK